ncbi:hypothetical protein GCM10017674_21550 [Streptomyces gardneri]|nr:hypothetical protein GCM10017674_21550 [Streptomyces gardneri]
MFGHRGGSSTVRSGENSKENKGTNVQMCRRKAIAPRLGACHHSRAKGLPAEAKWPTFTHSVAAIRIRRASGWWT